MAVIVVDGYCVSEEIFGEEPVFLGIFTAVSYTHLTLPTKA